MQIHARSGSMSDPAGSGKLDYYDNRRKITLSAPQLVETGKTVYDVL